MDTHEVLETYVEDWCDRMRRLSYDGLAGRQQGRFASLAFGAAGIAYAHWHLAVAGGDARRLEAAARWACQAWRHRGGERAFFPADGRARRHLAAGAFLLGEVGVAFVRVLVGRARGAAAEADEALATVVAACRRPAGPPELYTGEAGVLLAAALLLRATGEPRLRDPGAALAGALARRTPPLDGRPVPWRREPGPALAHGSAGVLFALLAWCRAAAAPPPPALAPAVDHLLADALAEPDRFCARPTFVASLCNGFSGLTVLALEAHAVLGGTRYLDAARRAVCRALAAVPPRPDLCCGRAGVAAACLALAGADPAATAPAWRRRAEELTLSALLGEPDDWEASGLYGGEAALPCLAADLLAGASGGPPALTLPARAAAPGRLPPPLREAS